MPQLSAVVAERTWQRIYQVIESIPAGQVATYGQIATAAGLAGQARLVGYALRGLYHDTHLPWHRVVNARGASSLDRPSGAANLQMALLEQEGVAFGSDGRLDLGRYRCELTPVDPGQTESGAVRDG